MNAEKRKALEAAGWRFGDAADFLGMTEEERHLLDARVEAALAVRRLRTTLKLSQKQLADRIKTSQPRVAKIERAAKDVSLDQILRAFIAGGGRIVVKQVSPPIETGTAKVKRKKAKDLGERLTQIQIELIGTEE
jgi:transcriptional regulator with XRE-family HTH domain